MHFNEEFIPYKISIAGYYQSSFWVAANDNLTSILIPNLKVCIDIENINDFFILDGKMINYDLLVITFNIAYLRALKLQLLLQICESEVVNFNLPRQ